MENMNESLKPVASFIVKNNSAETKRIALFSGHYDTTEIVFVKNGETKIPVVAHSNPAALVAAGYQCDQVADDYNSLNPVRGNDEVYPVSFIPKSKRTRVVDFMNYVKYSGLKVSKLRFTDLSNDASRALFNQEIEVTESSIGTKGGSDYIQLSSYINPRNFQTNVIEVDLEDQNLLLDETTVVLMDIVGNAHFQLDLILG